MTKALRVDVHPYTLELAREIERSDKSFRDLKFKNQAILVNSSMSLDGLVSEEEVQKFKIEKQLREAETPMEELRARVKSIVSQTNPPLINNE